ncbi:class II aldolase/adducin family protein [Burkholderia gladioli]|uniref:class II aldolase/adducin family protein n=1 Tax=Burkholderia gladioli TaxID=28095 RepID=UPI0016422240|nr:class II aldolase/adducin family protein [Burkholderia gladioli]
MNAIVSARRCDISPEEWEMRVNLAACYRLTALFGWDDLIFTHISARVPGPEHHFLINPYGMGFEEMTASSLVKVDLDGRKVSDSTYEINPAGFVIHSAVHAAREDAHCVMHVHSINGTAVSAQEDGLLPLTQHSLIVLRSLGYHDYEGIALEDEEKPRLVADLSRHTHLMLRNHGLLTVGASPAEAFVAMYFFEAACMMQVRAQAGGGKLRTIGQPILDGITRQMAAVTTNQGPGTLVWPSLLRKLDRQNPGYAQ